MIILRQSTASQEVPLGYFVDSVDGNTEETGLTIANTDIKLWKTGATTLANKNSGGGTHISNGLYYCVLDATDTNTLGPMVIFCHVAGALAVRVETCVLASTVYDSLVAATDNLQVDVIQWLGAAAATPTVAGVPEVDVTHYLGTTAQGASGRPQVDVELWLGSAPNALVSGRVDSSTGAMAANVLTATAINADAITAAKVAADVGTEIGTAVWASTTRLLTAGTNIVLAKGTGVTGFNDLDAAGVAGAVWNAATASYGTANTYGALVETNLDGTISSRASQTSVDTIDANVDAILADTAVIGAAGAGLTAIPWNAAWDAEVQSEAADALAAYDPPTNAEMEARTIAAASYATATNLATVDTVVDAIKATTDKLDTALELDGAVYRYTANALELAPTDGGLDAAGIRAAVGLASANLDTQLSTIDTVVDAVLVDTGTTLDGKINTIDTVADAIKAVTDNLPNSGALTSLATASALTTVDTVVDSIKAVTDKLDTSLELDGAVYRYTTNALEQAPTGSAPTAADIADAVWDEALAGHVGSGSTGEALSAAGGAGDPWITALPGSYTAGQAGYILGTNLDTTVSSRASQASLDALDDYVDTEVAAIKAKTDNLPSDPADASVIAGRFDTLDTSIADLPTNAELATALGTADDAVLTAIADLPTNAELATALAGADDAVLAAVNTVDTVVDAIKAKTDSLTFTVAGQVDANIQYVNDTSVSGTGTLGDEWGPA